MKVRRLLATSLLVMGIMAASVHVAGEPAQGQDINSDGWQLSVTPYFWFSGIEGDVKAKQTKVTVENSGYRKARQGQDSEQEPSSNS